MAASVSPANIPSTSGKDLFQDALRKFTDSLSPADRQSLPANPNLKDIVNFVSDANKLSSKRKSREYGERIQPFLNALHQFTGTIDVMIQSNPEITSLVWGSVKFFMTIVIAHNSYFENVSKCLRDIGKLCPLIEKFDSLLPDPDLQDAICEFYSVVINLFTSLVPILRKTGIRAYLKTALGSLKGQFQEFESQLERQRGYVDGYIRLASERAQHHERQLSAQFRSQVIDYTTTDVSRWNVSSDWRIQQDHRYIKTKRKLLLEKITGHNYHDLYFRHLSKAKPGTGNWIFDFFNFQDWETENSAKPILWCYGIPGSGKSVLTASITKYLAQKYPKSTAFFFCDFQQKSSLQWETVVRSLVRHLLSNFIEVTIHPLLDKFETPVPPGEIIYILQQLLKPLSRCYLVFDGIDECGETDRYKLLGLFEELISMGEGKVKIFVASRYSVDISRSIAEERVQEVNILQHIGPDIEKYIEVELKERIRTRRLTVTPEVLTEIRENLAKKADGMFLYVQFQLDDICTAITEDALRDCLQALPRGLPETYDRILSNIEKHQDFRMATKVFNWVLAAPKPLTVEELSEACAFEPGDKLYSDGRFATDDWKIIFNCNNLITIEQLDGKDFVHFAHSTVLDHLQRKNIVDNETANQDAACICLTYLSFQDFNRQIVQQTSNRPVYIHGPQDWIPSLTSASQNIPSTVKVVEAASKIHKIVKSKISTDNTASIDLRDFQAKFTKPEPELKKLKEKYKFLEYVRKNWIEHCRSLSGAHPYWNLFSEVVSKKTLPFQHLPWVEDDITLEIGRKEVKFAEKENLPSLETISYSEYFSVEWAVRCLHTPLLLVLQTLIGPAKWDTIMRLPSTPGERNTSGRFEIDYERHLFKILSTYDIETWGRRIWDPPNGRTVEIGMKNTILWSLYIYPVFPETMVYEVRHTLKKNPSIGIPLAILLGDTSTLSLIFQDNPSFLTGHKAFRHGDYLLDTVGLLMALSNLDRYDYCGMFEPPRSFHPTMTKMLDTIISSQSQLEAFSINTEHVYNVYRKNSIFIRIHYGNYRQTYLDYALNVGLRDAAESLLQYGATVRADQVEIAAHIGALEVVRAYFDARAKRPGLDLDDFKLVPESSMELFLQRIYGYEVLPSTFTPTIQKLYGDDSEEDVVRWELE
ncbi:hypothetical protein TWF718_010104 [Orbilia javanica]|uniref:NACHT domain-containing protein n=1 Tax=Orbilia javanica TaxID=47235 RepID=A0AAN8MJ66_9PEZI